MMTEPERSAAGKLSRRIAIALLRLALIFLLPSPISNVAIADSRQQAPDSGYNQRFVIRLAQPALLQASSIAEGRHPSLQGGDAQAYRAQLEKDQTTILAQIQKAVPGAIVDRSYQIAFNGLAIRIPGASQASLDRLSQLPGINGIYPEAVYQPTLYSSLSLIQTGALWQQLGGSTQAGKGVKIAILDNGIAIDHPMFDDSTFAYPTGYPKGDARYTTRKVIASRAYFRPTDPPLAGESTPLPGPLASGHGTHMAGIAAGNPVTAQYGAISQSISGVAPRSWLMNYRIFYPAADGEMAYSAEILRAIEDAVLDGANVLCAGWSTISPESVFDSPLAEALENAMNAGCIVVASAGNGGPGTGSASQIPGGIERVITVGAVSKGQIIASDLVDVVGPQPVPPHLQMISFARASFGQPIQQTIGPYPYVDVRSASPDDSSLACTPLKEGSLTGKIALIARGGCDFADKVYNVQQAGAVLALIYNDTDEITEIACGGQHCGEGEITIPTAIVTKTSGERLLAWQKLYPNATLQLDPRDRIVITPERVIQDFSGRGPAFMAYLKPDMVAPGVDILSAGYEPGHGPVTYAQLSGSSMACAHVAGAASLLLQAHPGWNQDDIKAALMGTASQEVYADNAQSMRAGILARGAGLVDLSRAYSSTLLLSPTTLALSSALPGRSYTFSLTLRSNFSGSTQVYSIAVEGGQGLSIDMPASVSLAAGAAAQVEVTISVPANAQTGDLEAEIHFRQGSMDIHLPVWVHVHPLNTTADILLIDNDSSFFDSYRDYAPYVTNALDALGYSYEVWNADEHLGSSQTIPNLDQLQRFGAIIWLTGDNSHPDGYYVVSTPLTGIDLSILGSYLDGGGRLIAIGQNLAEASDINPDKNPTWGRAGFYHAYLGAHWLQGNVFEGADNNDQPPAGKASIVALPQSFLTGMAFDIGAVGNGAHNQNSVDEIAPGGIRDGSDAGLVKAVLMAINAHPKGEGYVGVAKAEEPTLENDSPRLPYRTLYYSFGLEGINDNQGQSTRKDLLRQSLAWLRDKVQVNLQDTIGPTHEPFRVTAAASSSVDAKIISYRWLLEENGTTRVVEGNDPSILVTYSDRGSYPIAVEVTDTLGHKAVARAMITATYGGDSTITATPASARPGEEITYQLTVRNSSARSVSGQFILPLPQGTEYTSHTGGTWDGNALIWSGSLNPEAAFMVKLRVRVSGEARPGMVIIANANFEIDGIPFSKQIRVPVTSPVYLPLIVAGFQAIK